MAGGWCQRTWLSRDSPRCSSSKDWRSSSRLPKLRRSSGESGSTSIHGARSRTSKCACPRESRRDRPGAPRRLGISAAVTSSYWALRFAGSRHPRRRACDRRLGQSPHKPRHRELCASGHSATPAHLTRPGANLLTTSRSRARSNVPFPHSRPTFQRLKDRGVTYDGRATAARPTCCSDTASGCSFSTAATPTLTCVAEGDINLLVLQPKRSSPFPTRKATSFADAFTFYEDATTQRVALIAATGSDIPLSLGRRTAVRRRTSSSWGSSPGAVAVPEAVRTFLVDPWSSVRATLHPARTLGCDPSSSTSRRTRSTSALKARILPW
jgi:hypothetical protein